MLVIAKILVIFIMIGVGFFAYKIKILPEKSNDYVSRLVVLIGSPCLLFSAIVQKELTEDTIIITIEMMIGSILFFFFGATLAYIIVSIFKLKTNNDVGVYMALLTTINGGFMGFPVMKAAFGNEGLFLMVVANIILNVYLYSFGIIQIKYGTGEKETLKGMTKSIFNPCILASILGLFCLFLRINIPLIIMEPIVQIANITIPLSMISVGISIGNSSISSIIKNKKLVKICITKMLVWPLITFFAVIFTSLPVMVKCVLILMSTFPPAVSTGVIVRRLGKNAKLASEGIILTTLMSLITITVMLAILGHVFSL